MSLKYLFTATFADGSTIEQDAEDKSIIEPETRSRFYDVLHKAATIPLVRFELTEAEGTDKDTYAVDLVDGHFEINGKSFQMEEFEPKGIERGLEIIFFRQHTHDFKVSKENNQEVAHSIVYRIGWKLKGDQYYQRVMQFS